MKLKSLESSNKEKRHTNDKNAKVKRRSKRFFWHFKFY